MFPQKDCPDCGMSCVRLIHCIQPWNLNACRGACHGTCLGSSRSSRSSRQVAVFASRHLRAAGLLNILNDPISEHPPNIRLRQGRVTFVSFVSVLCPGEVHAGPRHTAMQAASPGRSRAALGGEFQLQNHAESLWNTGSITICYIYLHM